MAHHPPHRMADRVVLPPGMLSDDEPDVPGLAWILCRSTAGDGALIILRARYQSGGVRITAHVPYDGGGTVRGLLRLNARQAGHGGPLAPDDLPSLDEELEAWHPVTGALYKIKPADLKRAATLAIQNAQPATRAMLITPYVVSDGARVIVTGNTKPIAWPCDVTSSHRCLNTGEDPFTECKCTAQGREVRLIDDIAPSPDVLHPWHLIGNADILHAGTILYAGPEQLSSDHAAPRSCCLRCPRLAIAGLHGASAHCSAHAA